MRWLLLLLKRRRKAQSDTGSDDGGHDTSEGDYLWNVRNEGVFCRRVHHFASTLCSTSLSAERGIGALEEKLFVCVPYME